VSERPNRLGMIWSWTYRLRLHFDAGSKIVNGGVE
jgi:hypothetical protein